MKTLSTTTLQIALAMTLAGAIAACSDKPAPTVASSPAATEPPEAQVPVENPDAANAGADAQGGPTARELAAAPRGAMPESSSPAPELERAPEPAAPEPMTPESATPAANNASAPMASRVGVADGSGARYADVVSVQPVKRKNQTQREECRDERVVHRAQPKDRNQVAVTVLGGMAGGVIGNQVGGGRGRDAATVAGAVGGGYAGKKIQQNQQRNHTYTTTERRCRPVTETTEEVYAYDVVYEYRGSTQKVRLDHDPGDRVQLPVRGIE